MTATKAQRLTYAALVRLLASDQALSADQISFLSACLPALGISNERHVANVARVREAERLRALTTGRAGLNRELLRVNQERADYELDVVRRRNELRDSANTLLGEIEVADAAAVKLAVIEKASPHLFN